MSAILKAISKIMGEVGSVQKGGTNSFHNYKYATAADILHKIQPLMAREGLIIFQTEKEREMMLDGNVLAITYDFTLAHKDGETWPAPITRTGMSSARNTKGGFDDKAVNKCHTSAHKYFHLTLFEIPTGDYDDADADEDKMQARVPTTVNGKRKSSAQRGRDGEWDRLEADLLDCKSARDVERVHDSYKAKEYREWSDGWRWKAEERFAQRLAEFSQGDALAETLADITGNSDSIETKAAYVQWAHEIIDNAPTVASLHAWWQTEAAARTRFRFSMPETDAMKERCAARKRELEAEAPHGRDKAGRSMAVTEAG